MQVRVTLTKDQYRKLILPRLDEFERTYNWLVRVYNRDFYNTIDQLKERITTVEKPSGFDAMLVEEAIHKLELLIFRCRGTTERPKTISRNDQHRISRVKVGSEVRCTGTELHFGGRLEKFGTFELKTKGDRTYTPFVVNATTVKIVRQGMSNYSFVFDDIVE